MTPPVHPASAPGASAVPYWLDAQLPPQLAPWLTEAFGVPAFSAAYLGYRDATDEVIFEAARLAGAVIISKDSDFLATFPETQRLLAAGEDIVEIGG